VVANYPLNFQWLLCKGLLLYRISRPVVDLIPVDIQSYPLPYPDPLFLFQVSDSLYSFNNDKTH